MTDIWREKMIGRPIFFSFLFLMNVNSGMENWKVSIFYGFLIFKK